MSKEIVNSPAGDTVGELEQQVRLSLWEETVSNGDMVPLPTIFTRLKITCMIPLVELNMLCSNIPLGY